jgi:aspartyl protease family protein
MFSSGVNSLAKLVGGWTLALAVMAFSIVHFEEIRTALGLKFDPEHFGITPVPQMIETTQHAAADEDERERSRQGQRARPVEVRPRHRERELFTQSVRLTRDYSGHFNANASINGRTISVLVDTGATLVAMSHEDAMTAGISVSPSDFRYVSQTANGQARFARVTLDHVRIGNVVVYNVPAAVSQPGKLTTTLLGMSFLGHLRMEMKDGMLILEQ